MCLAWCAVFLTHQRGHFNAGKVENAPVRLEGTNEAQAGSFPHSQNYGTPQLERRKHP